VLNSKHATRLAALSLTHLLQSRRGILTACLAVGAVCLFSFDSNAAPSAKPRAEATATAISTPVGGTGPTEVRVQNICCHIGMYTSLKVQLGSKEASQIGKTYIKEDVTAQGDYYMVTVPAGTPPEQFEPICLSRKDDIFNWFNRRAEHIDRAQSVSSNTDPFKLQRREGWSPGTLNQPIINKDQKLTLKLEDKDYTLYEGPYTRQDYYTLTTAELKMCQPVWCGVKGSINGENAKSWATSDKSGITKHGSISERTSAFYRYSHTVWDTVPMGEGISPSQVTKDTSFSFPVRQLAKGEKQCTCQSMAEVPPPWHGALLDEVLPARDWWIPPDIDQKDRLSTDQKYPWAVCSAQSERKPIP
jgi:hypothetical protein